MLPGHPQFQKDEILSSWMVRLAFANGYPLHTFYAKLLECRSPVWVRDVDRHPALELVELLAKHTGQLSDVLIAHTLGQYEGVVFGELPRFGNAPWVRPAGVFHRQRTHPGMQYCPLCLACDPVPYFRARWRLAFYGLCHIHGTCMHDRCPVCGDPVMFHRLGIGKDRHAPYWPLYMCSKCGGDLRMAEAAAPERCDSSSLNRYLAICQLFSHRQWDCGACTPASPVSYFHGLRILISAVAGAHGGKVRKILERETGMSLAEVRTQECDFENRSSAEQRQLMLTVLWLLEDWPARFASVFHEGQLGRCRIHTIASPLPFWLAQPVDEYLDGRHYQPSLPELSQGIGYLESQGHPVSSAAMCRLFGQHPNRSSVLWKSWLNRCGAVFTTGESGKSVPAVEGASQAN